jgi:hypothetical protein
MKKDVVEYITRCMECQKVKDEHRNPASLLYPLPIPKNKWKVIIMDFITGLTRTNKQHDSIMAVVEKLTKDVHFVSVKTTHTMANIAEIFMKEIARLHGIHRKIVSDRDTKFTLLAAGRSGKKDDHGERKHAEMEVTAGRKHNTRACKKACTRRATTGRRSNTHT